MSKRIFDIPVTFQMWGVEHIEAETLQEAIDIAKSGTRPLPTDRGYINDSYAIDDEALLEANDVGLEKESQT